MINLVLVLLLLALVGGASYYIYRQKKAGAACVGCPCAKSCGGSCGSMKPE